MGCDTIRVNHRRDWSALQRAERLHVHLEKELELGAAALIGQLLLVAQPQ